MVLLKTMRSLSLFLVLVVSATLLNVSTAKADNSEYFPLKLYSYNSKILLGTISAYQKDNVRYLGEQGDWVNVQLDGGIPAWVKKGFVSVSSDERTVSIIKPKSFLYIKPAQGSRYLVTLRYGDKLNVIEDAGQWVQVNSPSSLKLKIKKLDYDRIYTRFGSSTNVIIPDVVEQELPVATTEIVYSEQADEIVSEQAGEISYSQEQIDSMREAEISAQVDEFVQQSNNEYETYNAPVESVVTPAVVETIEVPIVSVSSNNEQSSSYLNTGLTDYRLTPGDVISINVFGESDMEIKNARIPVNGFISFPLVGQVFVAGKTPSEVERSIETSLSSGYLSDPKVNLSIDVYRPVYVRGAVLSPGSYEYNVGLTVAKILTTAGGSTRSAIKDSVKLFRNNAVYLENLNLDSQELIQPGDIVSVDEIQENDSETKNQYIYMHGEVKSSGEYEYREGLTVEKAVALAGGFDARASKKRIDVSREVEGSEEPEKIKRVKLYFDLLPGDVVHVGESWF